VRLQLNCRSINHNMHSQSSEWCILNASILFKRALSRHWWHTATIDEQKERDFALECYSYSTCARCDRTVLYVSNPRPFCSIGSMCIDCYLEVCLSGLIGAQYNNITITHPRIKTKYECLMDFHVVCDMCKKNAKNTGWKGIRYPNPFITICNECAVTHFRRTKN